MAKEIREKRHILIELDEIITSEIELAYRELSNVEIKNNVSYQDFNQHRINHIQDLFDQASDVIKNLDEKNLTGDVSRIYKAKKHISENFGAYQFIKNSIEKAVDINRDEVLERTLFEQNKEILPETEQGQTAEEIVLTQDDEFLIQLAEQEQLAIAKEQKLKEKAKLNKLRQEAYRRKLEEYRKETEIQDAQNEQDRINREREEYNRWSSENNIPSDSSINTEEFDSADRYILYEENVVPAEYPAEYFVNTELDNKIRAAEYKLSELIREETFILEEARKINIYEELDREIYKNASFIENNYSEDFNRYILEEEERNRFLEQQRKEEAYRLGLNITGDRTYTSTDLEMERRRQDREEEYVHNRAEEIRKQQEEALRKDRERIKQMEEYESIGKSHIDFGSEFQKKSESEGTDYSNEAEIYESINEHTIELSEKKDIHTENDYKSVEQNSYNEEKRSLEEFRKEKQADSHEYRVTDSSQLFNKEKIKELEALSSYGYVPNYNYAPVSPDSKSDYAVEQKFDGSRLMQYSGIVSNEQIYEAIKHQANEHINAKTPYYVPEIYMHTLKNNVEAAREQWRESKGTPQEAELVRAYKEERRVFEQFKKDYQNNRYEIEHIKRTTSDTYYDITRQQNEDNIHFFSYTPEGVVNNNSSGIKNAAGKYFHAERTLSFDNFSYTRENPLIVSPGYRDKIYEKGTEAQKTLSGLVELSKESKYDEKLGSLKVSKYTTNNLKTSLDAYYAFRKAEKAGVVVVAEGASNTNPNFEVWSQRKHIRYEKNTISSPIIPNSSQFGTGQNIKAADRNNRTRRIDSRGVFNLIKNKKSSSLEDSPYTKQKSLTKQHFKNIYTHSERFVARASKTLTHSLSQVAQTGEDNVLSTIGQGRYYISSATKTAHALMNMHVVNSKKAAAKLARLENKKGDKLDPLVRRENEAKIKVSQQLEEKRKFRVSSKQVSDEIKRKTAEYQIKAHKKFGSAVSLSDEQLAKKISLLQRNGADIKRQIKELEVLGSKLTKSQREVLLKLKKRRESNNLQLRKLFGLKQSRAQIDSELEALKSIGDQINSNKYELSSGLHALLGFISKPFQQGDVYAASGLYNAAMVLSNRHTRSVLSKMYRFSKWTGGKIIDASFLLTGNDPTIWREAVKMQKAAIAETKRKAKENLRKASVKTARKAKDTVIKHTPSKIRTLASKSSAVTKNVKYKVVGSIKERYQRSLLHKSIQGTKRFFGAIGRGMNAISSLFSAIKAKIVAILLPVGVGFMLLIAIMSVLLFMTGITGVSSSTIISPYEDGEKLNLAPYVEILDEKQFEFDGDINNIMGNTEENGGDYRKITINYATPVTNNYKEILSMMAVRLYQNLSIEDNPEVKKYLESLYDDSHYYTTMESEPYACSGCEERSYKCTDSLDEYVTSERKKLHDSYASRGGCKEEHYTCKTGYECKTRYHDDSTEEPTDCGNFIKVSENNYVCQGHKYCDGHIRYYCDGHKETICRGEHIDLVVTINILGFDEIFTADTMGNDGFAGTAGEKIGNFKITYYCIEPYAHICNDGSADTTATGTKPTPGRTIAVDPSVIPLGSHVIIDGHEYVAEDTGGAIGGKRIDIVVRTHAEALSKGTRSNVPVYWVSYEGGSVQETGEWQGWTEDNIAWCKNIYEQDWNSLYSGVNFGTGTPLSDAEIAELLKNVPDFESLPAERQKIINTAYSLIGKIPYGWGQSASGPGFEGINFNKGLDCSHFVDWVYWTAVGDNLGNGSTATLSTGGKFVQISASQLLPGDLGFKWTGGSSSSSNANHVGIYTGSSNGLWVHCTGGAGVVQNNYKNFTVFYRYVGF